MSHLLRVLVFLACGPLLLPGGFCACADDHHESAVAGPEEPRGHSHEADCPATWEAVVAPAVSPDLTPAFAWLLPPAAGEFRPVTTTHFRESASLSRHVDPPLYLSHCALVI